MMREEDRFLRVTEEETGEEMEVPMEQDGSILLSSIHVPFPNATGLKYEASNSAAFRVLKVTNGAVYAPADDRDWEQNTYYVVYPKVKKDELSRSSNNCEEQQCESKSERKHARDKDAGRSSGKSARDSNAHASHGDIKPAKLNMKAIDLICLNLPYNLSEESLREYLQTKYGPLEYLDLKKNRDGNSRGFAFLRFKHVDHQRSACRDEHRFDSRVVTICRPMSDRLPEIEDCGCRIFVAKLVPDISKEDVKTYFSYFGKVLEVFQPPRTNAYCFVTFAHVDSLYDVFSVAKHYIKNHLITVMCAERRKDDAALYREFRRERELASRRREYERDYHTGGKADLYYDDNSQRHRCNTDMVNSKCSMVMRRRRSSEDRFADEDLVRRRGRMDEMDGRNLRPHSRSPIAYVGVSSDVHYQSQSGRDVYRHKEFDDRRVRQSRPDASRMDMSMRENNEWRHQLTSSSFDDRRDVSGMRFMRLSGRRSTGITDTEARRHDVRRITPPSRHNIGHSASRRHESKKSEVSPPSSPISSRRYVDNEPYYY